MNTPQPVLQARAPKSFVNSQIAQMAPVTTLAPPATMPISTESGILNGSLTGVG